MKCWFRAPSATLSQGPGSASATGVYTRLRGFRASGGFFSPSPEPRPRWRPYPLSQSLDQPAKALQRKAVRPIGELQLEDQNGNPGSSNRATAVGEGRSDPSAAPAVAGLWILIPFLVVIPVGPTMPAARVVCGELLIFQESAIRHTKGAQPTPLRSTHAQRG